jgi:preprotein translocase SecE subunit
MSNTPATTGKLPAPSSKRGVKGFFAETARELRKVNWPSRAETTRLTLVVLAVCTMQAIILLVLSYGFDLMITLFEKGGK